MGLDIPSLRRLHKFNAADLLSAAYDRIIEIGDDNSDYCGSKYSISLACITLIYSRSSPY